MFGATAHNTDPSMNSNSAVSIIGLRPNELPRRP